MSFASSARWSMLLSTALRNRHSTTGWIAVHFSLMNAWMREFSSSMLRWTAMEKSGRIWWSFGRCVGVEVARRGEPSSSVPMTWSW